jgi:hypothetical protein
MLSVHPAGDATLLGELANKFVPGTHPNQNVPIVVVPVSGRVMLYCQSDGPSGLTATDANAITAMEPLPTDQVLAGLPHSSDAIQESADLEVLSNKIRLARRRAIS